MKIKVVLASSADELITTQMPYRKASLSQTTDIVIVAPPHCPRSTESELDTIKAAPYIIEEVVKAPQEGFDAVTIDCMLEPGLPVAKKLVEIPVIGAAEAAFSLAQLMGERFLVIVPTVASIAAMKAKVRILGVHDKITSIQSADMSVLDLQNYELTLHKTSCIARAAIKQSEADVLVLGCTVMGPIARKLDSLLKIPVVDPGVAALKVAEALVSMGLKRRPCLE